MEKRLLKKLIQLGQTKEEAEFEAAKQAEEEEAEQESDDGIEEDPDDDGQ
jgi:hypothetical protein